MTIVVFLLLAARKFDDSSAHPFSQWFTWCQACRHGGHAHHITEVRVTCHVLSASTNPGCPSLRTQWFKTRVECPVTDCQCHCMSLDTHSTLSAAVDSVASGTAG